MKRGIETPKIRPIFDEFSPFIVVRPLTIVEELKIPTPWIWIPLAIWEFKAEPMLLAVSGFALTEVLTIVDPAIILLMITELLSIGETLEQI